MKIDEVRRLLQGHDTETVRTIAAELYKAVPKAVREDKEIHRLLADPDEWLSRRRKRRRKAVRAEGASEEIDELEEEIDTFLEDAYAQRYFAPNRFIAKSERSKWRFRVMRFVKELNRLAAEATAVEESIAGPAGDSGTSGRADDEATDEAARREDLAALRMTVAERLEKLYRLLSTASAYTLFTSDDPFRSVQISQPDFLNDALRLRRGLEAPRAFVERAVSLAVDVRLDPNSLRSDLIETALDSLPTAPLKEMAVEICGEGIAAGTLPSPDADESAGGHAPPGRSDNDRSRRERRNALAEFGCRSLLRLAEPERAVDYFRRHYRVRVGDRRRSQEIELFVLLRILEEQELYDHWQRVYETALEEGTVPRQRLQDRYRELRRATGRDDDEPTSG